MNPMRNPFAAAAAALALAACGPQTPDSPEAAQAPSASAVADAAREAVRPGAPGELDPLFEQAAREFNVPANLLKAVSFTETRWQMWPGLTEFEGMAPAYGVMALRGEQLARGAALAGVSEAQARTDVLANLRAGAALLSAEAEALMVDRASLGDWAPAVARFSGITHTDAQAEYVHHDVFATLRKGVVAQSAEGTVTASIMPTEVQAKFAMPSLRALAAGPDYAEAVWRPSGNYGERPAGTDISMIIIHTCESSYASCWSWLVNPDSGVSAHYVVKEDGSEISQLVSEEKRGWHIGATYDCKLNSNVDCGLTGTSVNHFSVGIEHGGSASQTSFPAGQIEASAKLSCDISRDRTILRDSYHIVAHGKLQPATRTDPGPNWPWASYLSKVQAYCTSDIIVDTNNANNDAAVAKFSASANWTKTSSTSGSYGGDYYYASVQGITDTAVFSFYLPAAATKSIEAWWTAGTNRSASAPFVIFNAAGTKLGTVNVNQQAGGSQWNALGSFSFQAGWNTVQVSRWTSSGTVVIADAIRVR
ncbi:N-acetylmuramoyl-L-alanine amidase [Stigmatella aurantiaca]|uniref:N-acetylmuramoyl-L-alanine amidase n=1 Tax=Stigmatella aurantiaca (strain DW4/3-1) TaxID=378806 RepID=E3FT83_STIAD|nr:N-acetylmuramoyl-L-alanine amidase [Stigmatella aurantiaca]ADO75893.1 N-acetylmuramoyl-L-alanine amidase [Stigmatella aurantiaca DW4/3-1]